MIAVLGDTGMLGGMVVKYFNECGIDVVGINRANGLSVEYDGDSFQRLERALAKYRPSYVINCIGAIKPTFSTLRNNTEQIYTNAIFPHTLSLWAQCKSEWGEFDCKVIHITTDCVFPGIAGAYAEDFIHHPGDEYGKSKSLGEPKDCMVLRSSIIGPEWGGNKRSLVEWLISQTGREVNGYTNHLWNGVTTLELAKAIKNIIEKELYQNGTHHIYSEDIDKYALLSLMNTEWDLGITVYPIEANDYCNRTLRTRKTLNSTLRIATQRQMARELRRYVYMER